MKILKSHFPTLCMVSQIVSQMWHKTFGEYFILGEKILSSKCYYKTFKKTLHLGKKFLRCIRRCAHVNAHVQYARMEDQDKIQIMFDRKFRHIESTTSFKIAFSDRFSTCRSLIETWEVVHANLNRLALIQELNILFSGLGKKDIYYILIFYTIYRFLKIFSYIYKIFFI